MTQLSQLQVVCSQNRKSCFFLTSSSSQARGPAAATSAGLQRFSEGTGSWLRAANSPSKKKGNRILVTPVSRVVRGAQESAERRARPGLSKARFGRGKGRWEGGTGRWCHSWRQRLSPDLQLHPCVGRENNARGENISTRPLNNVNYTRKQFEWKISCPGEFKRNDDLFGY